MRYELYGSSSAVGDKAHWKWAIFTGRDKKPMQIGSVYGSLLEAEEHAGAAIDRLKERTAREKAHLPTKQA